MALLFAIWKRGVSYLCPVNLWYSAAKHWARGGVVCCWLFCLSFLFWIILTFLWPLIDQYPFPPIIQPLLPKIDITAMKLPLSETIPSCGLQTSFLFVSCLLLKIFIYWCLKWAVFCAEPFIFSSSIHYLSTARY